MFPARAASLPASSIPTRRAAAARADADGPEDEGRGAVQVLLVEDDAISALALTRHLQRMGFTVCGVAAGEEDAVRLAAAERPDLVLMDIRLEDGGDGITAATLIQDRYGIPSLFVTAEADAETLRRAGQVRSLGLLPKPFTPMRLRHAMDAAVERLRGGA